MTRRAPTSRRLAAGARRALPDLRPAALASGLLLALLGVGMLVPVVFGNRDDQIPFAVSSAATLFVGTCLAAGAWGRVNAVGPRQAILLTASAWILAVAFSALPFWIGPLRLSYVDAFFESMSGLTTTGATVIQGLDFAPPGLLLWRGILQWIGGIGIVVTSIAILPVLRVGGMQIFRAQSASEEEKILPSAGHIAASIAALYAAITAVCALLYSLVGMSPRDAAVHAMTTIATGGFSNHDRSFAYFDSAEIEIVAVAFMIIGSLPFALYLQAIRGRPLSPIKDSQVRFFLGLVVVLILGAWMWRMISVPQAAFYIDIAVAEISPLAALRESAFNVVSVLTGTGYATQGYDRWGSFAVPFFLTLMLIGGCAGSTSCGLKIFRLQVCLAAIRPGGVGLLRPSAVTPLRYNGKPLAEETVAAVISFVFLFLLCFALLACALNAIGLEPLTAISAAAAVIANVGPGLGNIVGPEGTYTDLPDAAKILLAAGMLLGRLELLTLLALLSPSLWRA